MTEFDQKEINLWRDFFVKNPVAYRLMVHTKRYGPDTPVIVHKRLLGRRSGLSIEEIRANYQLLLDFGLMEKTPGKELNRHDLTSSIKKTLKRRQKYHTPRKTHTYYQLSRKGELLTRFLDQIEILRDDS
ncbi:MAG: DUF2250 domain-containing protein [Firmicutes bacterium]|jgi:predicted transcriptional regulator|uniref:DUF2250 domain-containing protein n=1 Tax=Sulfobacillus benefaciens TaxID=453960 RepID=A0A2T2WW27_9FIRM|nr:DUF2250 domain-containing protein [Bacillota bacterium]PSR26422.1 MAG: hypothetical protein C7B43_13850 [Sulfobacillus benefaciens]HBQ95681.1 hypothetical protein [Sulfobacillus sp.]